MALGVLEAEISACGGDHVFGEAVALAALAAERGDRERTTPVVALHDSPRNGVVHPMPPANPG